MGEAMTHIETIVLLELASQVIQSVALVALYFQVRRISRGRG